MGLAHQVGNNVTLFYRQAAFSRKKERDSQRIQKSIRKGKVKVIFNSNVVEITPDAVVLDVNRSSQRIPNDYVWVFAGGDPPTAFLKKIGIGFGLQDLTSTGSKEAKEATQEKVLVS
jgi:thioredoxin reductase (NADPH)